MFIEVVQGVRSALASTQWKRMEDAFLADENIYQSALTQMSEGSQTIDLTDRAFKASGRGDLRLAHRAIIYLTPVLIAAIKNWELFPERLRPTVHFVQAHLGTLYSCASLVSTVALLYFGQIWFALPGLIIFGIDFLDQREWLPLSARTVLHTCATPFLTVTGFLFGSVFDRCYAAFNLVCYTANAYMNQQQKKVEVAPPQGQLDYTTMVGFLDGTIKFKMNHHHIHYNPIPHVVALQNKILSHLQDLRHLGIDRVFSPYFSQRILLDSLSDLCGGHFGLRNAKNGKYAIIDSFLNRFSWVFDEIDKPFWESYYTLNGSVEHLMETLSKQEIRDFWQTWIDRLPNEDQKQALHDGLKNGFLFNHPLELNGKIQPRFILPILFDMGITDSISHRAL